ncbi:MAG: AI-2E family transporter [Deltaproteobacteria bacterium]|nr:AI-2E family transporter [Deltaproteobacteria bacterium]
MPQQLEIVKWILTFAALVLLLSGLYVVFRPFLGVIAWAVVTVLTVWPAYTKVRTYLPLRHSLAAFLMTVLLAAFALGLVIPLGAAISNEFESSIMQARAFLESPRKVELMSEIEQWPFFGPSLARFLQELEHRPTESFQTHGSELIGVVTLAARQLLEFVFKFLVFLFVTFFIFRDGASLGIQLRTALLNLGGQRFDHLLNAAKGTLKATVYGLLLTAIIQGAVAGVGYFVAGAPLPVLLGAATTLMSLIPFGPPFVYVPASAFVLLSGGPWWSALGLLLWGVLVVSTIDNVLRPIFISQRAGLSVVFVFIGVIGGTLAFGLIGVLLGPIIIALTKVLWNEWVSYEGSTASAANL